MEIVDAIKNAMRKVEGTNKRCLISCEWDDPENGWQDDVVLGTQERLHPDYADKKFFYPIQGWSIENEEGFVSREEAENDEDIGPVPVNIEDPVYDRENNEWVERKEWIENAIDFFLDTGKTNIEEIEKEFYEELPYHDKIEK